MNGIIIKNLSDIPAKQEKTHPLYEHRKSEVTDSRYKYEAASPSGGNQTVVAFYTLPPGKSAYPFHYHTANEEVFYIISGNATLETFEREIPLCPGDVIVCPAGKAGAHKLTNASETEDLVYLDVDTNNTPDIAYYPHSNTVGIRAAGGIRDNFRLDGGVGYPYE